MRMLIGDHIALRLLTADDAEAHWRWNHDPETTRWLSTGFPVPKATFVAGYQDRPAPSYDRCTFGIETVDEGRLIGLVGLSDTQHDIGMSELTVYIGESDGRGRGFGTEAVRLMCGYGFDRMGLRRIQLWVADGNAAAIACYRKVGFVQEGRARQTFRSGGVWHDMVLMGLLEDELR